MDPVVAVAGWLLGRLRADAETGLWTSLKGLVQGDPLTVALERVTKDALGQTVRRAPGGEHLGPEDVAQVVGVFAQVWPKADIRDGGPSETLLERLEGITSDAMRRCVEPVGGLGEQFETTTPLATLERDYGLRLDPDQFPAELASVWKDAVSEAAIAAPELAQLSNELNAAQGRDLHQATFQAVVDLDERVDGVTRQVREVHDQLQQSGLSGGGAGSSHQAKAVFPQFVGVPDRNRQFVGRTDDLDKLERLVNESGGAAVIAQVAFGLGGVGKTAIAAEFCHRQRERRDAIRWLTAEDRQGLVTAFMDMGPALGLDLTGLRMDDGIARVRQWFETTHRAWLLVFDNVETPDVLEGLIPEQGNGRALITSRYRDWSQPDISVLQVDDLPLDDAVRLLAGLAGRPEDANAEELVTDLGGLALAIEQAAAFCRQTGWSFRTYRKHLKERAGEILADNSALLQRLPGRDQDLTVFTVWDASLQRALTEAPRAQDVLGVLAYLAPDHIPKALLTGPPAADETLLHDGDAFYVDGALAALARYSLIEPHHSRESHEVIAVSVHRLVQEIARLTHRDPTTACATAIRLVHRVFPPDPSQPDTWAMCEYLGDHLIAAVSHAETYQTELAAASWLINRYATYLQHGGNPIGAALHFERAVHLYTSTADADDETLLGFQIELADSYRSVGRAPEAIELLKPVVAQAERVLGGDHPNTLGARMALALTYYAAGRAVAAIDLLEHVLAQAEHVLESDHPNTLRTRANLAIAYQAAGRMPIAIRIQKRLVAQAERVLGSDHPNTLGARANLASLYHQTGQSLIAVPLLEDVVAERQRILGNNHPDTLADRGNLASVYHSLGRTDEAIELLGPVVTQAERVLDHDHPNTLAAHTTLATIYHETGRVPEAVDLLEHVAAASQRVRGSDHPDTLAARTNLAIIYETLGRVSEAIELLEDTVADPTRVPGDDHPATLRARQILNELKRR